MRFWKGKISTNKEGKCGTMNDDGFVPDSEETTKEVYDNYVSSIPTPTKENLGELYYNAVTTEEKVEIIAKRVGLRP